MKINFLLPLLFLLMGTLLKGVPIHEEDLEGDAFRNRDNIQAEQGIELHLRQATEGDNGETMESHEQANEGEAHEQEGMIASSQAQDQVGMLKEDIANWHQRLSQRENYYKA